MTDEEDKASQELPTMTMPPPSSSATALPPFPSQAAIPMAMAVENEKDLVEDEIIESSATSSWLTKFLNKYKAAPYQQLVTDKKVLSRSLWAIRFGIFADACNSTILQPNYPVMVTPGADPDSFTSTAPFDFSTATYAIPMFALLGIAIAGLYSGRLSDKIGRKPVLMFTMYGSMVGSVVKFFLRRSFWGFCIANFANGLVSGSLPVALAYVGDVFPTPQTKAAEFGNITGCFVVGQSMGGIFAILMSSTGLFASLWIGAAMMLAAGLVMTFLCVEPKYFALPKEENDEDGVMLEEDDVSEERTEIDKPTMWHIIVGAFLDNFGSCGLFPICLSPLAFNRFYADFENAGLQPLLSLNGYKWVSIMVALVVIPTAALAPPVYGNIGPAGACVFGNLMTAVVIVLLWVFGDVLEATKGAMIGFIIVMYVGFPMTVFSQLSTSPMLDICSPRDKRGYVQGLNSTVMNVGTAFAPWILGIVADQVNTNAAIFIGMGVSVLAAIVNIPLMWKKGMGRPEPKPEPMYKRVLKGEEADIVEKALRGSWVSQEALTTINDQRQEKGQPYLFIHPRPYTEEKEVLPLVRAEGKRDFEFALRRTDGILGALARRQPEISVDVACQQANKSLAAKTQEAKDINAELGQWFADYLSDNGYYAHTNPGMVKEMIMNAFPTIIQDEELNPDNLEQTLLNMRRLYSQHAQIARPKWNYSSILGTGSTRTLTYV